MGLVLALMFLLMAFGIPIAYSIAVATAFGLSMFNVSYVIIPQRMFTMLDSFTLMAVPFFVLAGTLMDRGGMSRRMIDFAKTLVGHVRGGLAMVVVLSCILFGAISGSAAAVAAAIGMICIPAMVRDGYDKDFAAALTGVSAPLGTIIPPSIAMVIYSGASNASVGELFLAGYIPGIVMGSFIMLCAYLFSVNRGYPKGERATFKETIRAFLDAIWALMLIVIIMGGILSGIFTPTEAASVSCFYAVLVGLFVYKDLKVKDIPIALAETAITTAAVMFCVATSNTLSWLMTSRNLPSIIATMITTHLDSRILILLAINFFYLIIGCFMDNAAGIILSVPIFLPLAVQLGIDPVHFGIIVVCNLSLGSSTPPVGGSLFITSSISKLPIMVVAKAMLPMWCFMLIGLLLITYIPELSMFLVNLRRAAALP